MEKSPALIEMVQVESLHPDPANVRRHSPRNIAAIKASLQRFGQQKPIVVDAQGVIRAGNGAFEAARQLGWRRIQVIRTDLSGPDAIAYAIADNRSAELAQWDPPALAEQIAALEAPLQVAAGFADDEVKTLLDAVEQRGPDLPLASLRVAPRPASGRAGFVESPSSATWRPEKPLPEIYELAVVCRDEADQKQLYEQLTAQGRQCRVLTI